MDEPWAAVPEPLTELAERAVQLHEVYAAYQQAGFSEERAFELAQSLMLASLSF